MTIHRKRALGIAMVAGLASALLPSGSAWATTAHGCAWPYVCFYESTGAYNAGQWDARYKDLTSGFQTLGSSVRGDDRVYNSRNDDGALLRFAHNNGVSDYCLRPNSTVSFASSQTVIQIRIMDSPTC